MRFINPYLCKAAWISAFALSVRLSDSLLLIQNQVKHRFMFYDYNIAQEFDYFQSNYWAWFTNQLWLNLKAGRYESRPTALGDNLV
jgi:hypothetical protein